MFLSLVSEMDRPWLSEPLASIIFALLILETPEGLPDATLGEKRLGLVSSLLADSHRPSRAHCHVGRVDLTGLVQSCITAVKHHCLLALNSASLRPRIFEGFSEGQSVQRYSPSIRNHVYLLLLDHQLNRALIHLLSHLGSIV